MSESVTVEELYIYIETSISPSARAAKAARGQLSPCRAISGELWSVKLKSSETWCCDQINQIAMYVSSCCDACVVNLWCGAARTFGL